MARRKINPETEQLRQDLTTELRNAITNIYADWALVSPGEPFVLDNWIKKPKYTDRLLILAAEHRKAGVQKERVRCYEICVNDARFAIRWKLDLPWLLRKAEKRLELWKKGQEGEKQAK